MLRLSGRPLAIAPRALDALLVAGRSIEARPAMLAVRDGEPPLKRGYAVTDSGVAVVPIVGPMVARADWLTELFGFGSYGDVAEAVEAAFADPDARAVLLELDSPGGEVGGLFDLVDRLTALREEAGKPLWAVASESALSAGFAIASAADRLYVTRTGEVGSVGVVAIHVDESTADAMAGLKWTLIHAGAKKVDGNPHEPLSPEAFADIQADVDALHAELVGLIARNRHMGAAAVGATEAAIYRGQRAVAVGFADRVGTVGQALGDLTDSLDPSRPRLAQPRGSAAASPQLQRRTSAMTTETTTNVPPDPDPAEAPETPEIDPVSPAQPAAVLEPAPEQPAAAAAPSADTAERLRAEYAEIAAIAAQAGRLGVTIDAADAMAKRISPEALRRSVLDALSQRAEASAVVAAAPQAPAAGDSPIVRRARERAASANRNA
ncbi:MAG: S49 family peptidase [Alphaproteobacteria bacterium]